MRYPEVVRFTLVILILLQRGNKMRQQELISKLIDLDERAKAHCSEFMRLIQMPGNQTKATYHNRRVATLRSRIQNLMRQIALSRGDMHNGE